MSVILQKILRWKRYGIQLRLHCLAFHEYSGPLTTSTIKHLANLKSFKRTCRKSNFEQSYTTDVRSSLIVKSCKDKGLVGNQSKDTSFHVAYQQEQFLNHQLETFLPKVNKLTNQDWKEVRFAVLNKVGGINEKNIDAIIMNKCSENKSLLLGKSYFNFLRSESTKLNRAVYGNYLRLFYDCSPECNVKDCREIINVYEELVHTFPILDSYTTEKAILALSITERWTEYRKLFKTIELIYLPTPQVYSAIIKAAFRNKDFNLGWELMEEAQFRRLPIHDDVFIFLLSTFNDESLNLDEILTKILNFFKKFHVKPSLNLTEVIKQSFEKSDKNRMGNFTAVSRRGVCEVCQAKLEPACVSQEDFDELRSAFLNPVLIGKDIFLKTQPEEMEMFLSFLEKRGPFDVVLDGLNVALKAHRDKKSPALFAFQLKSVVKHFVDCNQKVLVLGRKHMTKWPAKDMQFVRNNSVMFLAEDISQDDPFLLYATLHSGLGTRFVSQDLMRGHKFLLADPKLQVTFLRWQAQHQYFLAHIENNGTVHVKDPIEFMQSIQQNSKGDWHIPYMVKENLNVKKQIDNFHRRWLCLVNNASSMSRIKGGDSFARSSRKPSMTYHKREQRRFTLDFEDLKKS